MTIKMKKQLGIGVIILALVISAGLWLAGKENLGVVWVQPLVSLAQLSGLLGITMLSITLLLSTKSIWGDKIFGGLDKMLKIHHLTGSIGFILLINHPLFLAAEALPDFKLAAVYLLPSADLAYLLGVVGLYLMIFAFIFLVLIRLPYHLWILSHRILGLAFISGLVHSLLIGSDISRYLPLKIWVILLGTAGTAAYIYDLIIFARFGRRYLFWVERIERSLDIINIYLKSAGGKFSFEAGQFVMVAFRSDKVSQERHPFTISSGPEAEMLRLSVKMSGDYTLKLPMLPEKSSAWVYGPYGSFGLEIWEGQEESQIWIGGGIGITPFLSLVKKLKSKPIGARVDLFYIFRRPEEGVFVKEIETVSRDLPGFHFHRRATDKEGRPDRKTFTPIISDPGKTAVFICGPTGMMKSLKSEFRRVGVGENKIYSEDFDLL